MAKGPKGPKKRKPLENITAGDKLTAYTRPPSIYDEPHRDRVFRGALVDSRLRRSPDRPFQEIRDEIEQDCREVFEAEGLPDPFSFIHPEGRYPALDGWLVLAKGEEYLKSRNDLGYYLAAQYHSPTETKHTPLWYAAQLATELTRLDLWQVQLRSGSKPPSELIVLAGATGARVGALASEKGFKVYEPDAISGGKHRNNTAIARGEAATAQKARGDQILEEVERLRAARRLSINGACEAAAKNGFGKSGKANRALFYRRQK